jgi:MFS family permease
MVRTKVTIVLWSIILRHNDHENIRTSDKIGRRPVLLIGLIGNTITILAFGQSHTLTWAIASRAACGFLNGNIGVAKSVMGEITDATNQAKGFSIFG